MDANMGEAEKEMDATSLVSPRQTYGAGGLERDTNSCWIISHVNEKAIILFRQCEMAFA